MAKFTVEHSSKKNPDETYKLIKNLLIEENPIQKFDANAKCTFDDATKTCRIIGGQFKAEMKVTPGGSESSVQIIVDLPLLLLPFKGKVQESLKRMLSKHLV